MMTRPLALVFEDEPLQDKTLIEWMLNFGINPIGPVTTVVDALELCQHNWPDLCIITLRPSNTSIVLKLAKKLYHLGQIPLIFLCENIRDSNILEQIYQTQPLAILPKPYQDNVLQKTIWQCLTLGTSLDSSLLPNQHAVATHNVQKPWLYVRERSMLVRIAMADIVCVHMDQQYAVLAMSSGRRYSIRMGLAEVLGALDTTSFVQCHRSWIVNLQHIERVDPTGDIVWLAGGAEAALGRAYRHQVLQRLIVLG